jgi:hypothetical protein
MSSLKYNNITFYKTSQWWLLTKHDANIIIKSQKKYLELFKQIKIKLDGAFDEYYFLTVLKDINKNY